MVSHKQPISSSMSPRKRALLARLSREQFEHVHCYHPDAPEGCGKPIDAHSISRGAALAPIADKARNQVLMYNSRDIFALERDGCFSFKPIGVRKASTFCGFCGPHDDRFFAELEKKPFSASPHQIFLLHYRAFARETHAKVAQLETAKQRLAHVEVLKERATPAEKRDERHKIAHEIRLLSAALRDLGKLHARLKALSQSKAFSSIAADVYWFSTRPQFVCAGMFNPRVDAKGQQLQDLSQLGYVAEAVSLSIVPVDGAAALVVGRDSRDAAAKQFADSLFELSTNPSFTAALTTLVFTTIENVAVSPDWWTSLPPSERSSIESRVARLDQATSDVGGGAIAGRWLNVTVPTLRSVDRI